MDRRYEQRFAAQEAAVIAALAASEKANLLADANAERWRAEANEWRGAMNDRERGFMSRGESDAKWAAADARFIALKTQIDDLREDQQFLRGREKGLSLSASLVIGFIGVIASLVAIYFALN
jgi:hypothetical protein